MRPIAVFAAGFVAGGLALGAVAAHARLVQVNLDIGGVTPGGEGSLLCSNASGMVRAVRGTYRELSVNAPGGAGLSYGVTLRCPA